MRQRSFILWFGLCVAALVAAMWGSIRCGQLLEQPNLPAEEERHLRLLIYFHFALAQVAIIGGCMLLYLRHRKWKRHYLIISYNEKGQHLNPPGIRMAPARVYRCCLGHIAEAELPPADDAPVLVYPMFMLSGLSSGVRLQQEVDAAFRARGYRPALYYQPVLGASPWLAEAAAERLRAVGTDDSGVLVVAHGSAEDTPEPALFCRRLRKLLPGVEVELGFFNKQPEARDCLPRMRAARVLLLPFLLTEGLHTTRDLPTAQDAAACGKQLVRLPVVATYLTPPPEEA
ncbi:MAG: CbiX/SirB N-terminal domain-containing protein [Akkermansia muciniphila]